MSTNKGLVHPQYTLTTMKKNVIALNVRMIWTDFQGMLLRGKKLGTKQGE